MDFDKYRNDVYYGSLTLWLAEQSRLRELFKQDLFKEFNIENYPLRNEFFELVWKYGNADKHGDTNRYQSVYNCAKDFLIIIKSDK